MQFRKAGKVSILSFVCILIIGFSASVAHAQSGLDLVLNYVEGQAIQGKYAFDVAVYFSLLDSNGAPVKDISPSDLTISEDGKPVQLDSLEPVTDEPIFYSLVLDTSGSMNDTKMNAAKKAAENFIAGTNAGDLVSVATFNSTITSNLDFTSDHRAAIDQVELINSSTGSGTCLYDAIYQTVQKTAALPMGRRAVIVLTDGKDELPGGGACSTLTIDDAINLASTGNTRVPIYTIGLGSSIDETGLKRIASLTGGRYNASNNASQLNDLFGRILDQLQSEFVAHYTSTAAPGDHNVVLQVNNKNETDQDSRSFVLSDFPVSVTFISPVSGQVVNGRTNLSVSITGKSQPIKEVTFKANEVIIGTDDAAPYEIYWNPGNEFNGEVLLSAVASGADGTELAHTDISVQVKGGSLLPSSGSKGFLSNKAYLYGIIGLVVVIAVALYLILTLSKKKGEKEKNKHWQDAVGGNSAAGIQMTDQTMDTFTLHANSFGTITIMQSDDPAMIGQRFEINEQVTRLGRAADNEILFPKDGAVSRHHAILENRNGQLILSEMISVQGDGSTKRPTFGTYVNDRLVEDPTPLMNGDVIRLGKRAILRFETAYRAGNDDAKTMDQLNPNDTDRTMD